MCIGKWDGQEFLFIRVLTGLDVMFKGKRKKRMWNKLRASGSFAKNK